MQKVTNPDLNPGKVRRRQLSEIQEYPIDSSTINLSPSKHQSPNHNQSSIIHQFKAQAQFTPNPDLITRTIQNLCNQREQRVYQTTTISEQGLIQTYFNTYPSHSQNPFIKTYVSLKQNQKHQKISQDILEGNMILTKMSRTQMSLQLNNNISIVSNVNTESISNMQKSDIYSKSHTHNKTFKTKQLHQMFKSVSNQTKLAAKYIRSKVIEQKQMRERIQKQKEKEHKKQKLSESQKTMEKQRLQKIKKDSLLQFISQKMAKRQEYKEKRIQRQGIFRNFIKEKGKPLFQKLQDQYQKRRSEQKQRQSMKLKQMRNNIKRINSQQLNDFEKSYLDKKEQIIKMRQSERQKLRTEESAHRKKYYRSVFHQFIQKQEPDSVEIENEKSKIKKSRREQYSQQVKQKIKISTDQKLKQELSTRISQQDRKYKRPKLLRKQRYLDKSGSGSEAFLSQAEEMEEPSHKQDGLRFLKFAKQKRVKTLEMKHLPDCNNQPKTQISLSHSSSKPTRLSDQQILAKFISGVRRSNYTVNSKKELLRGKAQQLDQKAHRSQQLLRLQKHNYPESFQNPEQYYIESIKTKIQLLRL